MPKSIETSNACTAFVTKVHLSVPRSWTNSLDKLSTYSISEKIKYCRWECLACEAALQRRVFDTTRFAWSVDNHKNTRGALAASRGGSRCDDTCKHLGLMSMADHPTHTSCLGVALLLKGICTPILDYIPITLASHGKLTSWHSAVAPLTSGIIGS